MVYEQLQAWEHKAYLWHPFFTQVTTPHTLTAPTPPPQSRCTEQVVLCLLQRNITVHKTSAPQCVRTVGRGTVMSHSIFLRPLSPNRFISESVRLVDFGNFWNKWVIWIGVCQQWGDGEQNCNRNNGKIISRWPCGEQKSKRNNGNAPADGLMDSRGRTQTRAKSMNHSRWPPWRSELQPPWQIMF